MIGEPRCALGVPNVGPFGDPLLPVELAVAAEERGQDGFFVWDRLLYHDQRWDVADPVAVIAAVAARTARIWIGILVNVLARRRIGEVARKSETVDQLSGGRLVVGPGLGSLAAGRLRSALVAGACQRPLVLLGIGGRWAAQNEVSDECRVRWASGPAPGSSQRGGRSRPDARCCS